MSERSVLDVLLGNDVRNVQAKPETSEIEIRRLSKQFGERVTFTVRALTYDEIADLRGSAQLDAEIVLRGTVEPSFKSTELAVKLGVLAPGEEWGAHGKMAIDSVKAMLLPGEIDEVNREIQRISGYLQQMTKVVKKN